MPLNHMNQVARALSMRDIMWKLVCVSILTSFWCMFDDPYLSVCSVSQVDGCAGSR